MQSAPLAQGDVALRRMEAAMSLYHGKAKLVRVLQPTEPVRVRPWGRFAWLVVAMILGAAFVSRFW